MFILWLTTKIIVTVLDPFVAVNTFAKVDVALIEQMSLKILYVVIDKNYHKKLYNLKLY